MFHSLNRRQFVNLTVGSAAGIGFGQCVPQLFAATADHVPDQERVLVVVQLSGGNDGLNTVVPFGDENYYRNRFSLAIGKNSTLGISDGIGFHPSLNGFSELLEQGQLGIVQGVGYPNPNRSHFESMDLWHTAHQTGARIPEGWIGRFLSRGPEGAERIPAIHLGEEKQPLALAAATRAFPSIQSLEQFGLRFERNRDLKELVTKNVTVNRKFGNELLSFVQSTAESALKTSERIGELDRRGDTNQGFPATRLGQKLHTVARMIGAEMPTSVYYVSLDGFDTHANQADAHAGLLRELGDAVNAFMQEVTRQGNAKRVLLFSFSEFGRRVRENASHGTDHGTAGPVFLAGGAIKTGLIGKHPPLDRLEQGDLKFHTDYRRIYAAILENWFQVDSRPVLNAKYEPLDILG